MRLSNQYFCRWWIHYNFPNDEDWYMAIAVLDDKHKGVCIPQMESMGFTVTQHYEHQWIYTVRRTNEDGTPYKPGPFLEGAVEV